MAAENQNFQKLFLHNCVVTYDMHILFKFLEEMLIFEFSRDKKPKFWVILSIKSKMAAEIQNFPNLFLHNFVATYYMHILFKFLEDILIFEFSTDKKHIF